MSTIINEVDTIIFQQMAMFKTYTRALFVHITIMKDKWLCSVAVLAWTKTRRKETGNFIYIECQMYYTASIHLL
jgi:hypothetical protein